MTALVMPDIAICADCRREICDPANRRYRYPFTNCTNCGPRFSIIESLPYDRANTSMKRFVMCPAVPSEYDDPRDRRFHAQPNACPMCGPQLALWDGTGKALAVARRRAAIAARRDSRRPDRRRQGAGRLPPDGGCAQRRRRCSGCAGASIARRSRSPSMCRRPGRASSRHCDVSETKRGCCTSPEAPIVLLTRRRDADRSRHRAHASRPATRISASCCRTRRCITCCMREVGGPVVATSGNLSDEPICTDEHEARRAARRHRRPVPRPRPARSSATSTTRSCASMLGRELVLRRARGYAPLPIPICATRRRRCSRSART